MFRGLNWQNVNPQDFQSENDNFLDYKRYRFKFNIYKKNVSQILLKILQVPKDFISKRCNFDDMEKYVLNVLLFKLQFI